MRHVVDEQDVGLERSRRLEDQPTTQLPHLLKLERKGEGVPVTRAGLHDGRQLEVVVVGDVAQQCPKR